MYQIGQSVSFIREKLHIVEEEGGAKSQGHMIVESEGIVVAIHLDPTRRKMVRIVEETGDSFNVEYAAINPSEEFKVSFRKLSEDIKGLTSEGNELVKAVSEEYNAKIEAVRDEVLGKPIEINHV